MLCRCKACCVCSRSDSAPLSSALRVPLGRSSGAVRAPLPRTSHTPLSHRWGAAGALLGRRARHTPERHGSERRQQRSRCVLVCVNTRATRSQVGVDATPRLRPSALRTAGQAESPAMRADMRTLEDAPKAKRLQTSVGTLNWSPPALPGFSSPPCGAWNTTLMALSLTTWRHAAAPSHHPQLLQSSLQEIS